MVALAFKKHDQSLFKLFQNSVQYIQEKFRAWLVAVNKTGLEETRKRPGWHDEPLVGERKGQRSIRLNKQWRAIYIIFIIRL